jgi:hypothetical protein
VLAFIFPIAMDSEWICHMRPSLWLVTMNADNFVHTLARLLAVVWGRSQCINNFLPNAFLKII